MCGRFALYSVIEALAEEFRLDEVATVLRPRYNIAPGQDVAVVVRNGGRRLVGLRWGLVPSWAKDPSIGNRLINARAETVAQKPSFRSALRGRRCLLPADGFFEWKKEGRGKVPMYIGLRSGRPLALAGLHEVWRPPAGGEPLRTCTILTTEPNDLMRPIHNRMPVLLDREARERWLDPGVHDPAALLSLLRPYPAQDMEAREVSVRVNSPRNDDPECVRAVQG